MEVVSPRIGYSFWGFLYEGIADTPDGGRIHRLPLIKSLISKGSRIYCLQLNRDLLEANNYYPIDGLGFSESNELPKIDLLLIEYRWPIPGRNTSSDINHTDYTPDLARQEQLLAYYNRRIPIIVWDKDLKLTDCDHSFEVAENTLLPRRNCHKLLFSFEDELRRNAQRNLASYNIDQRDTNLVYIGNQYDRDITFNKYINAVGQLLDVLPVVYGNWTKYPDIYKNNLKKYPYVEFRPRLHFKDINQTYSSAFSTVLIAPDRYYANGQITQRIFEAISNHTIPFVPIEYRGVDSIILKELFVKDAEELYVKINEFRDKGNDYIRVILDRQLSKLKIFSPNIQADALLSIYKAKLEQSGLTRP